MIGRSYYRKLPDDQKILVALASPPNMEAILESAMDEPPNLGMIDVVSAVCTKATTSHPYDPERELEYERLAGLAREFLNMVSQGDLDSV